MARPANKSSRHFDAISFVNSFILSFILITLPIQNSYAVRAYTENFQSFVPLTLPTPPPIPERILNLDPPAISAEGVLITDINSNIVLYEKNPDERLFPASTTKIMTALVSLNRYSLDDVVTIKTVIDEGQTMDLVSGETITVENLLYGMLVYSANDAAYALAEHHPQGVAGFVEAMNNYAQKFRLTNTHFVNPIGFDDPQHYTTARDLTRLAQYALDHPIIAKMAGIARITVSDTTYSRFHELKNINELLGKVPGVSGLKTGWTQVAGQALVTTVVRDNHKVLIVLLRSEDRFGETEQLVNWIFSNHIWKNLIPPR